MKKAISVMMCVLFVLTMLNPAGIIITACLEYRFELVNVSAYAIIIAALSICVVSFELAFKDALDKKVIRILATIITPVSLINAAFCILECPQIWVIASILFTVGSCCYLTVKYGKPFALKIAVLVLSALMILPIGFFSLIALIFGNIAKIQLCKL